CRRRQRSGRRVCGLWKRLATFRRRHLLATFPGNNDSYNEDDEQQPENEENTNYDCDNPEWKTGFLFSFSLCLLAALDQAIHFRVLRKHSLDFFKLRNRRRVIL